MAAVHVPGYGPQQYAEQNADQVQINRLAVPAEQFLGDCSKILVFTADGQLLFAKSCQVQVLLPNH